MKELNKVLKERLEAIVRWEGVDAYRWDDKNMPADVVHGEDSFVMYWKKPKSKTNHHPMEYKEVPLTDLDKIITKQKSKLNKKYVGYR